MRIFNKAGKKFCRNSLTGLAPLEIRRGKRLSGANGSLSLMGFTLVEILVAIAVLSLLAVSVLTVLNISDMVWNADMGLVDLQQQTRQAMARMIREIRQADSVTVGSSTVTFSIPWAASGNITYSLVNGQIIRTYNSLTNVLANDINSLIFSLPVSDVVEIQLRAQKPVRGRTIVFPVTGNLIEKVRLRN